MSGNIDDCKPNACGDGNCVNKVERIHVQLSTQAMTVVVAAWPNRIGDFPSLPRNSVEPSEIGMLVCTTTCLST